MQERILIVDDDKKMVKLIKQRLERDGYVTLEAYDGQAALGLFNREQPDLVVLDIMMPRLDGFEFCSRVREKSGTPIIFLSAKSESNDKIAGFKLGADDYITKPFSLHELAARIRAVFRRSNIETDTGPQPLINGPLSILPEERKVDISGKEVVLTATEFDMLYAMTSDPGKVFSRRELLESVRGEFFEGYERTVDAHIGNIRKKLGKGSPGWSMIDTVHGVGYKFNAKKTKK